MRSERGLTILELLVALGIFWLLLLATAPALNSVLARLEMHAALRAVTSGLGVARYTAIRDNRPVRVEVANNRLLLSQQAAQEWREIRRFDLGRKLAVRANNSPVFSPLGFVSPLCTITLEKEKRVCRVVLSMFGRIQVQGGQ